VGNPRRFFGTLETSDLDGFVLPPQCAVEVTFRAHQERFLLRPDAEATETLLGCFGRAYHLYPELNVHAVQALSNHGCFVASPTSPAVLSSFMRDFLSKAARRLNLVRHRDGTFWQRRYRAIPIVDEPALLERFEYVLLQGTKENLVENARDWPGITSIPQLCGGEPLVARWRDKALEYERGRQLRRKRERAEASGRPRPKGRVPRIYREYPIELHPLPQWKGLKPGQQRAIVADMVRADAEKTKRRHKQAGTKPLGVRGILATDPEDRPEEPKKSPAPRCHASSRRTRRMFDTLYAAFMDGLRVARERLISATAAHGFAPGTTTPPVTDLSALGPRPADVEPTFVYGDADPATGPPARR
jgi:hypothetical protein